MSWPLVIALIMLTPLGWVGLICLGVAIACILFGAGFLIYLVVAGFKGVNLADRN